MNKTGIDATNIWTIVCCRTTDLRWKLYLFRSFEVRKLIQFLVCLNTHKQKAFNMFSQLARSTARRSVNTGRRNMSMHKALAEMGETNAIVGSVLAAMALTGVINMATRSSGSKSTRQGFTSVSDGQPYTTDPAYAAATVEYRKFQKMDPITEYKKSGRV